MGSYCRKTITGYREVGRDDNGADYYVMTAAEYERGLDEKQDLEIDKIRLQGEIDKLRKARTSESIRANQAEEKAAEYEQRLQAMQEVADNSKAVSEIWHKAYDDECELNKNLIRIMTERANAARGIKPKKERDGYIVLESREWQERYKVDVWKDGVSPDEYSEPDERSKAMKKGYLRVEDRRTMVWKTLLQTPYDAGLPLDTVRKRIEHDIRLIGGEFGLERMTTGTSNEEHIWSYADLVDDDLPRLYRWDYRANYKSGYWEVDLYTTQQPVVPEHRRPTTEKNQKRKGENSDRGIADDSDLMGDMWR